MNNFSHILFKDYRNVLSKLNPNLKESKFYQEGILTPEEFIKAGDFLIKKCPSWKWMSAKEKYYNKALPKDKQYLQTIASSYIRANDYLKNNVTIERIIENDWVDTDLAKRKNKNEKQEVRDLDGKDEKNKKKEAVIAEGNEVHDFNIEGENDNNNKENRKKEFIIVDNEKEKNSEVKTDKNRIYDISVTYDFYYCVPRMWLMGYDKNGNILSDEEMKEDIFPEYRNKICTIEPQTCTGNRNISVHPCRQSLLLKKMIENFDNSGKKLEVEMSILFFLKFLQSVMPTVKYDFTMDINL